MKLWKLGLLVLGVAGCGAGSAGKAVRPDDPTAADALGDKSLATAGGGGGKECSVVPTAVEPLVVDWSSGAQVDLGVAMKTGIALVSYDCKTIQLVKDCKATGAYAFTSVPSLIQESVKIRDADEAQASLPFSGAKIGAGIARGSSIDIALAYVGKRSAQNEAVAQTELSGAGCSKVTHFVRRATVGAYVMATGTRGEVRAAAEIFGAGASAASSSKKDRLASGGDVAACKSVKDADAQPPSGCGAVLRLELQALSERAPNVDPKAPLANTCPDGFVMGNAGSCIKKSDDASYVCDMTDPDECKQQCKKNNAGSCFNAGTIAAGHEPDPVTRALFKKACDGNVPLGCLQWGKYAEGAEWPAAEAAYRKGCMLGNPKSCKLMAFYVHNSPMKTTLKDRLSFYEKACDLGDWEGCQNAVELLFNGRNDDTDTLAPNPAAGLKILNRWCDSNWGLACGQLMGLYEDGRLLWGWNKKDADFPKDPTKGAAARKKYCALKKDDSRCKG
jgi:uncharacterized protein